MLRVEFVAFQAVKMDQRTRKKRETSDAVSATIEVKILNDYSVYDFYYQESGGDEGAALAEIYLYFSHVINLVGVENLKIAIFGIDVKLCRILLV